MTLTREQLFEAVLALPQADQYALVELIEGPPGLSEDDPGFNAELYRRLDDFRSGRDPGISVEDFLAESQRKHGG